MRLLILRALFLSLILSPIALLADDGFEEISYESLLKELKTQSNHTRPSNSRDFFGSVMIHAGLGLISSQIGIDAPGSDRVYRRKNGFQLAVGIDLLTPEWMLEGAVRNYGQREQGEEFYGLREFDLRVVHSKRLSGELSARFGGGLAARYLNYEKKVKTSEDGGYQTLKVSDSTPSALATLGLDYFATRNLSFGVDFNARSGLIADTSDKFAVDMTFRMDTHF